MLPGPLGAAVYRYTLDRVNEINDSLKKKKKNTAGTDRGRGGAKTGGVLRRAFCALFLCLFYPHPSRNHSFT